MTDRTTSTLLRYGVAIFATCVAVTPCLSNPVHDDEAVSGDLSSSGGLVFALDAGVNTVRGRFGFTTFDDSTTLLSRWPLATS